MNDNVELSELLHDFGERWQIERAWSPVGTVLEAVPRDGRDGPRLTALSVEEMRIKLGIEERR